MYNKNDANNNLHRVEGIGQSVPNLIGILTVLRCLVPIWKSLLEYMVSYGVDKLKIGYFFVLKLNLNFKVRVKKPKN